MLFLNILIVLSLSFILFQGLKTEFLSVVAYVLVTLLVWEKILSFENATSEAMIHLALTPGKGLPDLEESEVFYLNVEVVCAQIQNTHNECCCQVRFLTQFNHVYNNLTTQINHHFLYLDLFLS
ncbi:hypothetical protein ACJX0J_019750 [Zea mays]